MELEIVGVLLPFSTDVHDRVADAKGGPLPDAAHSINPRVFGIFREQRSFLTMLARILRRPSVATAVQRTRTGLADFFEAGRDPNSDANINYGKRFFVTLRTLPPSTKSLKEYHVMYSRRT